MRKEEKKSRERKKKIIQERELGEKKEKGKGNIFKGEMARVRVRVGAGRMR